MLSAYLYLHLFRHCYKKSVHSNHFLKLIHRLIRLSISFYLIIGICFDKLSATTDTHFHPSSLLSPCPFIFHQVPWGHSCSANLSGTSVVSKYFTFFLWPSDIFPGGSFIWLVRSWEFLRDCLTDNLYINFHTYYNLLLHDSWVLRSRMQKLWLVKNYPWV